MKAKKFGMNAMFGIKEDGTVECLEIGNFIEEAPRKRVILNG